jgi:hypothetical protein
VDVIAELRDAETMQEFDAATNAAQEERANIIRALIRMVRKEREKERIVRICYLLGEYRATEAVLDLAKHVAVEAEVTSENTELPRWGKYPAKEALVKCGSRSIRYMLANLETSDDEKVRELSAMVIWQVMGGGLPRVVDGKEFARVIVTSAMEEQADPAKKLRLRAALKYFKMPKKQLRDEPAGGKKDH